MTETMNKFKLIVMARIAKHNEAQAAKDKAAKEAEDARIAAAVEAERKAGEVRAAAAVEAERVAEAARTAAVEAERIKNEAAAKAGEPQNFAAAIHKEGTENPLGGLVEAASTTPIQQSDMGQSLNGLAGKSVRAIESDTVTEFLALQACSPADKKAMRATIEKWEAYRVKVAEALKAAA